MLRLVLIVILTLLGALGLLLFFAGLAATLSGSAIALPGLGLIVSGPLVMLLGLLIVVPVFAALWLLAPRRTIFR
ncbi:MAG: hypothetical protein ACRD9R_10910 [Pyrinomonadaceae bacterium]